MDKDRIVDEIKRTAAENGGRPLGEMRFENVTGISPHVWRRKFWRVWGEALVEAGFIPNERTAAVAPEVLVAHLANLTREMKRFPTEIDLMSAKTDGASLPHRDLFRKIGDHATRIQKVRQYAEVHPDYQDILAFLHLEDAVDEVSVPEVRARPGRDGRK